MLRRRGHRRRGRAVRPRSGSREPAGDRGRAAFCVALLALLGFAVRLGHATETRAQAPPPPNVVVIVSDDQPTGMVKRMPVLRSRRGVHPLQLLLRQQPALLPDARDAAHRPLLPPHRGRGQPRRAGLRRHLDARHLARRRRLRDRALRQVPEQLSVGPRRELRAAGLGPLVGVHPRRRLLRLHAGRRPVAPQLRRPARATTRPTFSPTRSTGSSPTRPRPTTRSSPTSRRTARTRRAPRRRATATRSRTRG